MRHVSLISLAILLLAAALSPGPQAYERYNDGCMNCHGAFTDSVSTKGSVFPGDDKHTMHRASNNMNTECDLCHTSGDNRNPFIGSSDGTANNPGLGCTGCHQQYGLRDHHIANGADECTFCHSDPAPPAENVVPTYYGTVDTNADGPCNTVAQANTNENWTIGDFEGLDNDGDNQYDGNDPDCGASADTPGEANDLIVTAHDPVGPPASLTVSYDNTTCATTEYNFHYGALDQVASYTFSGQDCAIGTSGTYVWNYPVSPASVWFVIVARDATKEGSYGTDSGGTQRPAAGTCPETQDLSGACDASP